MAKPLFSALVFGLLLLLAVPLLAQPPRRPPPGGGGRGPGGFERDPFFDALREVYQDSPNKELFDLVNDPRIRSEIKLSEADADLVKENIHSAIRQVFEIRDRNRGKAKAKAELQREIRDEIAPFFETSYQLLEKNCDFDRLLGIYVQARGFRAALNDQIAKRIELEGEQLTEFRKSRSEAWKAIMEDTRRAIDMEVRNAPGRPPREAIQRLVTLAEKKLDAKLGDALGSEQRANLEKLKGPYFDTADLFAFPPPGSGRGPDDHERERNRKSEKASEGNHLDGRSEKGCCPDDGCAAGPAAQIACI